MPKVPYQGLTTVNQNPLPQERQSAAGATPEAFGGAIAEGNAAAGRNLNRASEYGLQVANDIQQQRQETELTNNMSAWEAYTRDTLVGTPDSPGYFSNHQQDALDKAKPTGDAMAK